jgi:hypothetical protein
VHHSSSYPRKVQLWAYFKPDGIVFFFFWAPLNFVQSKALGQGHSLPKEGQIHGANWKKMLHRQRIECIQYKNIALIFFSLGLTFA